MLIDLYVLNHKNGSYNHKYNFYINFGFIFLSLKSFLVTLTTKAQIHFLLFVTKTATLTIGLVLPKKNKTGLVVANWV